MHYICRRCKTEYFAPGECDWCPGSVLVPVLTDECPGKGKCHFKKKADMWDVLATSCHRLGVKYEELVEIIQERIRWRK